MTREEILAMPAGREMDALVAEHIFGYRWVQAPQFDAKGPLPEQGLVLAPPGLSKDYEWPRLGVIHPHFFLAWPWSLNVLHAWDVLTTMEQRGRFLVKVMRRSGLFDDDFGRLGWECELRATQGYFCAAAEEPALAICRAALLTLVNP